MNSTVKLAIFRLTVHLNIGLMGKMSPKSVFELTVLDLYQDLRELHYN